MNWLGLEMSSARGSVALSIGSQIVEQPIETPREQTERVLELIDQLLRQAQLTLGDLDGIAFGRGPGSFTGLRVAAAVAQGLALSSGVPLLPVSSLLALAQGAWRTQGIDRSLVCIDARMGEVYWAELKVVDGLAVHERDDALGPPSALSAPTAAPWSAIGNGFAAYAPELAPVVAGADRVLIELTPSARDLLPKAAVELAAGRTTAAAEALPVYLREQQAWRR